MVNDLAHLRPDELLTADVQTIPGHLHSIAPLVPGYKHAMVQIIAASIGLQRSVIIQNCPWIEDTRVLAEIIQRGGGTVLYHNGTLQIDARRLACSTIPADLAERVHGSIYLLPVLLGRFGTVQLPTTGGCRLSSSESNGRPVSHMLNILSAFGATFTTSKGVIYGQSNGFHATCIDVRNFSDRTDVLTGPYISGATKTAILAAMFVKKEKTVIRNPYPKPDVSELLRFLRMVGYEIEQGAEEIQIGPGETVNAPQIEEPLVYDLMSCISTIMTYITIAVHTQIPITIRNVTVERVKEGLAEERKLLKRMGVPLIWGSNTLSISAQNQTLHSVDIDVTSVGIYSDHQPFFSLLLLHGNRPARIREFVWAERFDYARELVKLGARISFEEHAIIVFPSTLHCSRHPVYARDLRAAAVLLIAATGIAGSTRICNVHHLTRGYENLLDVLSSLGCIIELYNVTKDEREER